MKYVPIYPIFFRERNWGEKDTRKFGLGGFVPNLLFLRSLRFAILETRIELAKKPISRMDRVLSDEERERRDAKIEKLKKKQDGLARVTFWHKLKD
ncbi:Uncharacterised protein [Candidatus Gugararchaeum adminiculabundum]|nr:Uncharacterised protein [Candidatus Gugararchaeum adminiculabundum]